MPPERFKCSRRGGGFRGRGQGGGRGGRGGFRGSSAPYRVPTNPPQATLQFRNANESDINNKLDQPGIKSITFGVDFQVQEERPDLGANLKELVLYDQHINGDKETKATTKARKRLVIRVGETLGDGIADNVIAVMTGGAMTTAWKNGKMVDFGVDEGFYGSGGYDMPFF
uniref:Uncharacterized protein n=1 Tax=Moniliophthora roreri TaxID=221103 RepID=A0A0W0F2Y8_MONRR